MLPAAVGCRVTRQVETAVKIVKRQFLAPLRHEDIASLADPLCRPRSEYALGAEPTFSAIAMRVEPGPTP